MPKLGITYKATEPILGVSLDISNGLLALLSPIAYDKVLAKTVRETANYSENQMGVNLKKMVYADKLGTNYVFTGRLLRGRKSRQIDPLEIQITSDPTISGAEIDYAEFVNSGTLFMRGRPFFNQTITDTKKENQIILQKNINKLLNG